jgi:hypothetical protein
MNVDSDQSLVWHIICLCLYLCLLTPNCDRTNDVLSLLPIRILPFTYNGPRREKFQIIVSCAVVDLDAFQSDRIPAESLLKQRHPLVRRSVSTTSLENDWTSVHKFDFWKFDINLSTGFLVGNPYQWNLLAICKGQILANAPQLLRCAYIS